MMDEKYNNEQSALTWKHCNPQASAAEEQQGQAYATGQGQPGAGPKYTGAYTVKQAGMGRHAIQQPRTRPSMPLNAAALPQKTVQMHPHTAMPTPDQNSRYSTTELRIQHEAHKYASMQHEAHKYALCNA